MSHYYSDVLCHPFILPCLVLSSVTLKLALFYHLPFIFYEFISVLQLFKAFFCLTFTEPGLPGLILECPSTEFFVSIQ